MRGLARDPKGLVEAGSNFAPLAAAMAELLSLYSVDELALILDFATKSNRVVADELGRLRRAPATAE